MVIICRFEFDNFTHFINQSLCLLTFHEMVVRKIRRIFFKIDEKMPLFKNFSNFDYIKTE